MGTEAQEALEDSACHHQASKTFSGALALYHKDSIKTLIDELGVTSILDFGAGKGLQYEGPDSLESFWGVPVAKYDPAWPPFAVMPKGSFDLVICTHTLCWIPKADLEATVALIDSKARLAIYVGEMLGPTKKTFARHPERFPRNWERYDWVMALASCSPRRPIYLAALESTDPERRLDVRKITS